MENELRAKAVLKLFIYSAALEVLHPEGIIR